MSMEAEYLTQSNERGLVSHKCSNKAVIPENELQIRVVSVDLENNS